MISKTPSSIDNFNRWGHSFFPASERIETEGLFPLETPSKGDPSLFSRMDLLKKRCSYQELERDIALGRGIDPSFFIRDCLGQKKGLFDELEISLIELRELASSHNFPLVKSFFQSIGLISDNEIGLKVQAYDLNRYYKADKFLLVSLLKHAAGERNIKIPNHAIWKLKDIETLYKKMSDLDLKELLEKLQEESSFPWPELNQTDAPVLWGIFHFLEVKNYSSWSPQMNFLAKHNLLHFLVEALKTTLEETNPVEQEEMKRNLDRWLESGNIVEIDTVLSKAILDKSMASHSSPALKGSLKVKQGALLIESLYKEEGWDFLQKATFRNSLSLNKLQLGDPTLSMYLKLTMLKSAFELFYGKSLTEIERLKMDPCFKDLLDIALSYRDVNGCNWIFHKIAYERYLEEVKRLGIEDLSDQAFSFSSIFERVEHTKERIKHSDFLEDRVKDDLLWALDSFPFYHPIPDYEKEIHFLLTEGKKYLEQEERSEHHFQNYIKLHEPLPDIWDEEIINHVKILYYEFIDKQIVKLEREGAPWKQAIILELEQIPAFDFEKLDRTIDLIESSNPEEALFHSFSSGCLKAAFFLLSTEFNLEDRVWKEIFHSIESKERQKNILKEMLTVKKMNPYFNALMHTSDGTIKEIGYQLLEEIIETSFHGLEIRNFTNKRIFPLSEPEILSLFFQSFLQTGEKEIPFLDIYQKSVTILVTLNNWLIGPGKNSILSCFLQEMSFFSGKDFIPSKSPTALLKEIIQSIKAFGRLKEMHLDRLDKNLSIDESSILIDLLDEEGVIFCNSQLSSGAYFSFFQALPEKSRAREFIGSELLRCAEKEVSFEELMRITSQSIPSFSLSSLVQFDELSPLSRHNHFPWKPFKNPNSALARHVQEIGIDQSFEHISGFTQYVDGISYVESALDRLGQGCSVLKRNPIFKNAVETLEKRKEDLQKQIPWDLDALSLLIDDWIDLNLKVKAPASSGEKKRLEKALFGGFEETVLEHTSWLQSPIFQSEEEDLTLYSMYRKMKETEAYIFTPLEEEFRALKMPNLYLTLSCCAEQAHHWDCLHWFIKKVRYTKYEQALQAFDAPELYALQSYLKEFPLKQRIDKTLEFLLEQEEAPYQKPLLEALKELSFGTTKA